ncbi:MAG: hypothetical protein PUH10_03215 [Erysipelotrichaceae bacterium]|uniref:hypothetical protein n=1 Tax=Floccifex sp. TaxID=2815810 RepID=UPI002A758110|nr:hypothetical protein [Floccifex sp.]MDD7280984.1 hypothetical protein [Erysipelotrichaceae bacterium]MDY2958942.1 hypothetical protein [Floccifex sp.]
MKKGLILLLCLSLVGCSNSIVLSKQTFTIELGEDVYANPSLYIKDSEKVNTKNMKVVCKTSGVQKVNNRFVTGSQDYLVVGEYDFCLKTGSNDINFKVKIKDTKPPTVQKTTHEITIPVGTIVDWSQYFPASDISGVSYSTSPILNTSTPQDCTIMVKIADCFGNNTEYEVVVHVV